MTFIYNEDFESLYVTIERITNELGPIFIENVVAEDWHMGDLRARVGGAKIMAASGRRAILSPQNSFNASKPELFKEGSQLVDFHV